MAEQTLPQVDEAMRQLYRARLAAPSGHGKACVSWEMWLSHWMMCYLLSWIAVLLVGLFPLTVRVWVKWPFNIWPLFKISGLSYKCKNFFLPWGWKWLICDKSRRMRLSPLTLNLLPVNSICIQAVLFRHTVFTRISPFCYANLLTFFIQN